MFQGIFIKLKDAKNHMDKWHQFRGGLSWLFEEVSAGGGFCKHADIVYLIQVRRNNELVFKVWLHQEVKHIFHRLGAKGSLVSTKCKVGKKDVPYESVIKPDRLP